MESKHYSSKSSNIGTSFLSAMLSSHMTTTLSKNMVASQSLYYSLEWNVIQKKIGSFLFLLLVLSTIFLLFILYSSNTYNITIKDALKESSISENLSPPATREALINECSLATTQRSPTTDVCDLSMGKWVKEPRGPLYNNTTCRTLPDLKDCMKYGKEPSYLYWRWKPEGCELPRFDPETFLAVVRGKKLAFIGDSLARNQMESLLCLLSQAETPIDVYKDDGDKFRTWHFPSHNFTLMVMWTEFFVEGIQRIVNGTATASYDIHLDKINTNWTSRLPGLDFAVISGGNWFFRTHYLYEGGKTVGCLNCREDSLRDLGVEFAIRSVVRKALEFVSTCAECDGLVTFLRTYTPSHFENGSWFTGGYCNRTQPLSEDELGLHGFDLNLRKIQFEEMERVRTKVNGPGREFGLLDVTTAMMLRADGHPGAHYDKRWVRNANDCLHWCLPGPVDMWNEVLLETLKKYSPL